MKSGNSQSRSSRLHSRSTRRLPRGTSAASRDDPNRRLNEVRQDVEAAIHVLDNGVNRTPLQLQRTQGAGGAAHGGQHSRGSHDMGSSIFQSSFLMSSDGRSGSKMHGGGGMSGAGNSTSLLVGDSTSHRRHSALSMETSMHSASVIGGSICGGSNGSGNHGSGAVIAGDISRLLHRQALLDQCIVGKPKPLTDAERRAWARTNTTVTLTETPTIFLYSHQDEFVSNEDQEAVAYMKQRNAAYAALEEATRVGAGTKYQQKGTMTFAAPKKSIHSEVQPPKKREVGALQVTPWMLKDEFAPLINGVEDDDADGGDEEEEEEDELEQQLDDDGGVDGNNSVSDDQSLRGGQQSAGANTTTGSSTGGKVASSQRWIFADSFMSNLRIMERAVVQNYMEEVQLAYRGIAMDPSCARRPMRHAAVTDVRSNSALAQNDRSSDEDHDSRTSSANGAGSDEARIPEVATFNGTIPTSLAHRSDQNDLPAVVMSEDVEMLWCFRSPLTVGRSVTCMTWNRKEEDILAVGYSVRRHSNDDGLEDDIPGGDGSPNSNPLNLKDGAGRGSVTTKGKADASSSAGNRAKGTAGAGHTAANNATTGTGCGGPNSEEAYTRGLVCCWSLKNPLAPELVLQLNVDAGVSSLAFSYEHPSLLAVGNTDGGIVVYDIQKDLAAPSICPAVMAGLHTGAVWDLRWVARGKERGEFLMSISADGRVVQWAVGKAIEKVAPDLMHLKRQPGAQVESAFVEGVAAADEAAGRRRVTKEEAVLSRQSGGMSFDVCPADTAIYVVGTEDGSVYQCNKSQTETYDLDYAPHSELVYRVRWCPYSSDYFLTCSADWTTRLYKLGQIKPALKFDSPNQDAVQDVAWSSTNSRAFATATAQGNVELWSVMDTIYPHSSIQFEDHRRLSSVLFADQETPVVVVGDEEGDVTVFLLSGDTFSRQDLTDDEQEKWLKDAIQKQSM